MDCLRDMDRGAALACLVGNRGDDEFTGLLGDAAEARGLRLRIPLAVEVVGDVEGRCARECVGDTFANAVVVA